MENLKNVKISSLDDVIKARKILLRYLEPNKELNTIAELENHPDAATLYFSLLNFEI